jgi:hypothetical protein
MGLLAMAVSLAAPGGLWPRLAAWAAAKPRRLRRAREQEAATRVRT